MVDDEGGGSFELEPVGSEEVGDAAVHCEALKLSLTHTKDGVKITFLVQPQDFPPALFTDLIGSRYLLAMVKLGDDERPVERQENIEAKKYVTRAALLCQEPEFQRWMFIRGYSEDATEENTVEALRGLLEVSSRSELATNEKARRRLDRIVQKYEEEKRK